MTKPQQSVSAASVAAPESENRNNAALDRCVKAWQRTFDLASIDEDDDSLAPPDNNSTFFARTQASLSFRDAMPPLSGYENIRDFIACTTYAMLKRILDKGECKELYRAAKIAMALLRINARP
jgi:hypothetical protein